MKIQQSALPYIILLLVILIGTPVINQLVKMESESEITTIIIEQEEMLTSMDTIKDE